MSATGSVAEFRDFDDLTKGTPGYSHRLLNLYEVGTENKDTRHTISFEEAVSRLISGVKSTIWEIERQGKTVQEFILGKTYVEQREKIKFRPDKPSTWNLGEGINGRWGYYKEMDYSGLVVLACVMRDMIPDSIKQNIRFTFTFTDEDDDHKKEQEFVVDQQLYTLALEQRLIQHFMLIEPDKRLRNHSLDCGNKSKTPHEGDIIYLAFKMKSTDENDDKYQSNDSFGETTRADTKRSPAPTTDKEKGKKVTIHDTDCVLTSSGTEEVTPDKYMTIRDLNLGTNIRVESSTEVKPKERKKRGPNISEKERKVINEEILKFRGLPPPEDYDEIFERVHDAKSNSVESSTSNTSSPIEPCHGVESSKEVKPKERKKRGPNISEKERKVINEEILKFRGLPPPEDYDEIFERVHDAKSNSVESSTSNTSSPIEPCHGGLPSAEDYDEIFERVLERMDEFEENIYQYYSRLLSDDTGREALKNRVKRVIRGAKKRI